MSLSDVREKLISIPPIFVRICRSSYSSNVFHNNSKLKDICLGSRTACCKKRGEMSSTFAVVIHIFTLKCCIWLLFKTIILSMGEQIRLWSDREGKNATTVGCEIHFIPVKFGELDARVHHIRLPQYQNVAMVSLYLWHSTEIDSR